MRYSDDCQGKTSVGKIRRVGNNKMLEEIGKIGIFLVIAQAVLYFVPGEAYEKYVKVIIGIIMIALTVHSVFSVVKGEKGEEIRISSKEMQEILEKEQDFVGAESSKVIYEGIKRELAEYEKEKEQIKEAEGKNGKAENGTTEEKGKIVIEKNKVNKITSGGKEETLP